MKNFYEKLGSLKIFGGHTRSQAQPQKTDVAKKESAPSSAQRPSPLQSAVQRSTAGKKRFDELGLHESLLKALREENYVSPTPIQERAIPELLLGKDLLGIAQTGTGKTAAFALPVLQLLEQQSSKGQSALSTAHKQASKPVIKCLVLAPTRELAIQVQESFATYGRHLSFRSAVILGGVGMKAQIETLRKGVDILVATPGRLLDLQGQGFVRLNEVALFVLDEADRMLDMGFLHDVKRIIKSLPHKRQNILFSATMPPEIQALANSLLQNPVLAEVAPRASTAAKIEQAVYYVEPKVKISLLLELLRDEKPARTIVFTRMKHMANKVAAALSAADIPAEAIHGNKSQSARQRALDNFKCGATLVLVASDLAARGIDIDGVTHVFNFDLPNVSETYVHRIGRTGRAGAIGHAIAFCSSDERPYLKAIEKLIGKKIEVKASSLSQAAEPEIDTTVTKTTAPREDHRQQKNQPSGHRNFRRKPRAQKV